MAFGIVNRRVRALKALFGRSDLGAAVGTTLLEGDETVRSG
jgi:hypothetical protein